MYFLIIIITTDIQDLTCLQRQRPFVVFCDVIGIDQIGFVDSCKMMVFLLQELFYFIQFVIKRVTPCLLYTSDAADEEDSVDLGGRPLIKKKKKKGVGGRGDM